MLSLYIYLILFFLLLIGSCITLLIFYKKYNKLQINFMQKISLYSLGSTALISAFALVYCISTFFQKDTKISSLSRPNIGEGNSTISVNIDSEIYSGTIDLEIEEKHISFEEAVEIFSKYREELDSYVLGNNISFCEVTSPLNFPSHIGSENISISWYISDPDIIDYTGNILLENIESESMDLEIVASLKLEEHTAEICYYITVKKLPPTAKEQISQYINNYINDSSTLEQTNINLPSSMNGKKIVFYDQKSSFPPIYFFNCDNDNSHTNHNS